jgi:exonuclease III
MRVFAGREILLGLFSQVKIHLYFDPVICIISLIISHHFSSFKLANTKVVVVAVYFPSTNRSFDEYMKTLETLEQICLQYKNNKTNLILLGDFNAHIEENKVGQKWNKRNYIE